MGGRVACGYAIRGNRAGMIAGRWSLGTVAAMLSISTAAPAAPPPALGVKASSLIDADTGQQLYAMNARAEVPIASATKLMTALVAVRHARLDRVVAAPSYQLSAVDSQI